MKPSIVLVGPVRSGKTTYLAGLLRASHAFSRSNRSVVVTPNPWNPDAVQLAEAAEDILCGRLPEATREPTVYEIDLEFPGSVFFGLGRKSVSLVVVDTPGGDGMPDADTSPSDALSKAVASAKGVLMVFAADPTLCPCDLGDRVSQFADHARKVKHLDEGEPAFSRVACTVTMADALKPAPGRSVFETLESAVARDVAAGLLGSKAMQAIRRLAPAGGDWYALTSTYGFDRRSLVPRAGLGDGRRVDPDWWPYRPFEPLEFLARGFLVRDPWVPS